MIDGRSRVFQSVLCEFDGVLPIPNYALRGFYDATWSILPSSRGIAARFVRFPEQSIGFAEPLAGVGESSAGIAAWVLGDGAATGVLEASVK